MAYYFVQHGKALSKDEDPQRPLSTEGGLAVVNMAKYLKSHGVAVNAIFHSGKTRAQQTAAVFAEQLSVEKVQVLSGMNPTDDVTTFASTIQDNDGMYIGHLPHIGKLVSYLITGDENAAVVKFSYAAIVCVKQVESEFYIDWVLSPAIC